MNKRTLTGIAIGLIALTFVFLLISLFAAALIMIILGMVFTAFSIILLVISMSNGKRTTA